MDSIINFMFLLAKIKYIRNTISNDKNPDLDPVLAINIVNRITAKNIDSINKNDFFFTLSKKSKRKLTAYTPFNAKLFGKLPPI